jgi:carboxymethylenebutenolidase
MGHRTDGYGDDAPQGIGRRALLARVGALARGTVALAAIAPLLEPGFARALQIAPEDPRIRAEPVTIRTDWGGLQCYLARPAARSGKVGSVIVAHDYWGLTPHFEDVARRVALEGFVALAPDYASRFGGTPAEEGPAREVLDMLSWADMISDSHAALQWLKTRDDGNGNVGAVGFGWGGNAVGRLATKSPDLAAGAVFYGRVPPLADVAAIRARLLLNYAGQDQLVDPGVPGFVDALRKAGVSYEIFTYEGVQRAFDDDSSPARYAPEAAKLAWSRTAEFLRQTLG